MRALSGLLPLLWLAAVGAAGAQSLGFPAGYDEYVALLRTPIGALPPLSTSTILGVAQGSPQVAARFGYIADITRPLARGTAGHDAHGLAAFGLTGVLPVALGGTLSVTAGVANERCDGCRADFMASVAGDYRLFATAVSDPRTATRLTIGVGGEVGFGTPAAETVWSARIGVPLALSVGDATRTRIVPFLAPAVALVRLRADEARADATTGGRFVLGGGVALYRATGLLGANIGFQYISLPRADVEIGVALSYGGR